MNNPYIRTCLVLGIALLAATQLTAAEGDARLRVVTTLPDYAAIARAVGGDRVEVESIVRGDQDAHFIRPGGTFY